MGRLMERGCIVSLLINYNPLVISYDALKKRLEKLLQVETKALETVKRVFEIPVCYGGEYGPDLKSIAEHAGLTEEEVVKIRRVGRHQRARLVHHLLGHHQNRRSAGDGEYRL